MTPDVHGQDAAVANNKVSGVSKQQDNTATMHTNRAQQSRNGGGGQ